MAEYYWIVERIKAFEDKPFLKWRNVYLRYFDIARKIDECSKILAQKGVKLGDTIAIKGDYSPDAICLLIALLNNNNIAVMLPPISDNDVNHLCSITESDGCFEYTNEGVKYSKKESRRKNIYLEQLREEQESGIVIFTSGSSGERKGAIFKAGHLLNRNRRMNKKAYKTLIFLRFDHIGGLNTLFSVMLNGGYLVVPEQLSIDCICKTIEINKIELLPTTPTFLNMIIMSEAYKRYDMSSLKMVSYGTEPIAETTLEDLKNIFPNTTFKQTYGLTELGIFATKSKNAFSKWMKIGGEGVETKVVDGVLWIRSRYAMMGYLDAKKVFDNEGWYNTGDLVEEDGEYIKIIGRKTEMINVGGDKVSPTEVESVLLEMDVVEDVLVRGKKSPITGEVVEALIKISVPIETKELRNRVYLHCKQKLEEYKIPRIVSITKDILVSDRSKKIRKFN